MQAEERKMSPLEEQIYALQIQKKKADLLRHLLLNLQTLPLDAFKEVSEEVVGEVAQFINLKICDIELGKPVEPTLKEMGDIPSPFTTEEVEILKTIAVRAQNRTPTPPTNANAGAFSDETKQPEAPKKPMTPSQRARTQDKIQFALANRHLDQKRVTVQQGPNQVGGTVVGLDAPFVIVRTDTGHTVPVELDHLITE